MLAVLFYLSGCKNDETIQVLPKAIPGFTVMPIHGGGIITYTIPEGKDVYYILAEYERGGKIFTERSSVYKNLITVDGFSSMDVIKVKVYTVNQNEIRSEPVEVEISPLEAPIHLISKSLKMAVDFGGITATWENQTGTEIGVKLLVSDDNQVLNENKAYYSYVVNAEHIFNGFEPVERTFAIYFEDKWGNVSDTTLLKAKPFFEGEVPKPFAQLTYIPKDNNSVYSSTYAFNKIYDGIVGGVSVGNGYLPTNGGDGNSFTIDLKEQIQLSRVILYHRWREAFRGDILASVNIETFEMWGTDKIETDKLSDLEYWSDDSIPNSFKNKWTYLGKYKIVPPDAGLGSQADANYAAGLEGFAFRLPLSAKPVRYIRLFVRSVMNGRGAPPLNNYYMLSELSFFGDNQIPQY